MQKGHWMALIGIGTLFCTAAAAQDAKPDEFADESAADTRIATDVLDADQQYADLWALRYPISLSPSTTDWPESIDEVDFQDLSIAGRMGQMRNLSLLTIAEIGDRRLFLGVNNEGLVGIHLLGFSGRADRQYMEVVRMPYLGESEDSAEDEEPQTPPE